MIDEIIIPESFVSKALLHQKLTLESLNAQNGF